jgi:hypothetical protein
LSPSSQGSNEQVEESDDPDELMMEWDHFGPENI